MAAGCEKARYVVYRSLRGRTGGTASICKRPCIRRHLVTCGDERRRLTGNLRGTATPALPRQLGYKSVKYLAKITLTDTLKPFGKGLGSASPEGWLLLVRRHLGLPSAAVTGNPVCGPMRFDVTPCHVRQVIRSSSDQHQPALDFHHNQAKNQSVGKWCSEDVGLQIVICTGRL